MTTTNDFNFIKNYGDRTLADSSIILIDDITFSVERVIDMNNDGWNDFVYDLDTYWGIFKNNGNLTFTNLILDLDGGGPAQPSLGNINSDSLPDLIISYSFYNRSSVTKYLLNTGNFYFSE